MSWSISLSGTKEMVEAELDAAQCVLAGARTRVSEVRNSLVNVSMSGSAYSSPLGSGVGSSFTVNGFEPTPPPPQPEEMPATEAIPDVAPSAA